MYFRVFIKFRVCTCIHDTWYTIHDIDNFRVYTVTSLIFHIRAVARFLLVGGGQDGAMLNLSIKLYCKIVTRKIFIVNFLT